MKKSKTINIIMFLQPSKKIYGSVKSGLLLSKVLESKGANISIYSSYPSLNFKREINTLEVNSKFWPYSRCIFRKGVSAYVIRLLSIVANYTFSFLFVLLKNRELKKTDVIISNTTAIDIGYLISKLSNKKHVWILREYGDYDYDKYFYMRKTKQLSMISSSAGIISISKSIEDHYKLFEHTNKIIAHNGIELERFSKIKEEEIVEHYNFKPDQVIKFVFLGNLTQSKGVFDILEAFKKISLENLNYSLELNYFGEGEERENLEIEIKHNQLENKVFLKGYTRNIESELKQSHFVVMASKFEALGRVAMEAMACSRIIISYNQGGIAEILENKVNGFVVPADSNNLYQAFSYCISNESEMPSIAIEARKACEKMFDSKLNGKKIFDFIYKTHLIPNS